LSPSDNPPQSHINEQMSRNSSSPLDKVEADDLGGFYWPQMAPLAGAHDLGSNDCRCPS
jgi:hypothetical protein